MNAEDLRKEILRLTAEYYKATKKQEPAFVTGESNISYGGRYFDEKELCSLVDSSLDFWLTYGRYSREFEKKLANILQVRYALLVNSGSSANLLAFYALTSPLLKERKINRGDEVITVAAGFPTTVAPIVQYGAVPVFVDIDEKTANIDVEQLENAYSPRTKAVILAHTLGNPFHIRKVQLFCKKFGLWLIEDNCDALGSLYEGRMTGSWGDIGTSSFYPPHHLTMGEGGAVYTNDPLLKKILLSMRDWGRDCYCESGVDNTCKCRFSKQYGSLPVGYDHKYVYSHFGFNLKVTDMQAAIGCVQLDKLETFGKIRRKNFQYLYNNLKGCKELSFLEKYPESDPSYFGFLITISDDAHFSRNKITAYLEENHIQTRNLFAGNLLRHPCFQDLSSGVDYRIAGDLIHTDKLMNDAFWIGVYPGMTQEKLDYMIEKIQEFIRK